MRKQTLFQTGQEYQREFQPFGRVQAHELDAVLPSLGLTFAGLIPQDGSSSATDWIEHLPHGLQPHLLDPASGFVFSANHMPIGSWYPIPVRFGNGGAGHTHRSRRLEELLGQLPATVDLFEVAAPRTDTVNPARRDLVELAVWVRDNQPSHPLSAGALSAVTQLEPWWQGGAAMDSADPAVALAWLLDLKFRASVAGQALVDAHGGGENGLNRFLESSLADVRAEPWYKRVACGVARLVSPLL